MTNFITTYVIKSPKGYFALVELDDHPVFQRHFTTEAEAEQRLASMIAVVSRKLGTWRFKRFVKKSIKKRNKFFEIDNS